ncbi:MAG TPA: coenzyme F420-0:L-glutamate ligase [Solirubrobacteraceae bacterium]|nr:coenzyme F420-0:L-glutamate ligase [Solirubrobacteraceae bacterium]
MPLTVTAINGIPEVSPGDDLATLIATASNAQHLTITSDDVIVVAHKVISKAEGRIRHLGDVEPSSRAIELANALNKDPRRVQVVLDESREVLRASHGPLITVTRHGFVCANAGVDASNVPGDDALVLLPQDPDESARNLRARLKQLISEDPAVLITDSFGRAWRHGQVDVAIGCAGLNPLEDWRGRPDKDGRELRATWIAVADELAAAADLARTKDGSLPVILISGAGRHVTPDDGPGAAPIIRPESQNLFR